MRVYRAAHPGAANAYMRKWNKENKDETKFKERYKNKALKQRYGITLDQQKAMAVAQGNKCPLCDRTPKRLVTDHDHATGKLRELLCDRCNIAMHIIDNPELLTKALAYKQKHQ